MSAPNLRLTHPFRFNQHQFWVTLSRPLITRWIDDLELLERTVRVPIDSNSEADLDYWIFGAFVDAATKNRLNHLTPNFIDPQHRVRFHLIDPLYKSGAPILFHNNNVIELQLIQTVNNISAIYRHPDNPNWTYQTWAVMMPSWDLEGWSRLKVTITDLTYRNELLNFRPTQDDMEFTYRIWSAIYGHIVASGKPVVIVDLVKNIYDPPHRRNLPELVSMTDDLRADSRIPTLFCDWSYNWMPSLYRIPYDDFKYRWVCHTGTSEDTKKTAKSIKQLIGGLANIAGSEPSHKENLSVAHDFLI
jgi:hypothetical protein